jgi:hypothetical protein
MLLPFLHCPMHRFLVIGIVIPSLFSGITTFGTTTWQALSPQVLTLVLNLATFSSYSFIQAFNTILPFYKRQQLCLCVSNATTLQACHPAHLLCQNPPRKPTSMTGLHRNNHDWQLNLLASQKLSHWLCRETIQAIVPFWVLQSQKKILQQCSTCKAAAYVLSLSMLLARWCLVCFALHHYSHLVCLQIYYRSWGLCLCLHMDWGTCRGRCWGWWLDNQGFEHYMDSSVYPWPSWSSDMGGRLVWIRGSSQLASVPLLRQAVSGSDSPLPLIPRSPKFCTIGQTCLWRLWACQWSSSQWDLWLAVSILLRGFDTLVDPSMVLHWPLRGRN